MKQQSDYSFKSTIIRISLASVLIAFFLFLALWQFRRAEEVQFFLDQRLMAQQRPVINFPDSEMMRSTRPEDQKVRLQGVFDADHQFLLDNQVVDGRAGYHVLTPFLMEGGAAILIDRGWVPLEADRSILPQVTMAHDKTEVVGELHGFFRVGLRLSSSHAGPSTWPRVIPFEDLSELDKALGYPLLPYQVLLSPDSGPGYVRKWTNTLPDPNRNKGYAFQWLGMAVMTVLWFFFQFRNSKSY